MNLDKMQYWAAVGAWWILAAAALLWLAAGKHELALLAMILAESVVRRGRRA
jgi:hypothetical protein